MIEEVAGLSGADGDKEKIIIYDASPTLLDMAAKELADYETVNIK